MMNEQKLMENKDLRYTVICEVQNEMKVLQQVKTIVTLPFGELHTLEQVAEYYEVTDKAILNIMARHEDELLEDGYKVWKRIDFEQLFKSNNLLLLKIESGRGFFTVYSNDGTSYKYSPRGVGLFTTRAVLRVGMLLRDSQVAKEVRTQLLNIHEATTQEAPHLVTQAIDYELQLQAEIGQAIMSGDAITASIKAKELQEWKDRHAVKAYNKFLDSDGLYTVTNACKMLGLKRNKTYAWLRSKELVFKQKAIPTKKATDSGIMKIVIVNGYDTLKVTPQGIEFLMEHLDEISNYVAE